MPVAYSTITTQELPVQVNADLLNFRMERYVDGRFFDRKQFTSLEAMVIESLQDIDFDELVHISEDELAAKGFYIDELDEECYGPTS